MRWREHPWWAGFCTRHLLRGAKNAERLLEAIGELERGETERAVAAALVEGGRSGKPKPFDFDQAAKGRAWPPWIPDRPLLGRRE